MKIINHMDVTQLESLIEVLDWFCSASHGCHSCFFDMVNCPLQTFVKEIEKVIKDFKKRGI